MDCAFPRNGPESLSRWRLQLRRIKALYKSRRRHFWQPKYYQVVVRQPQTLGLVLKHATLCTPKTGCQHTLSEPTCLSVPTSLAGFSLCFGMSFLQRKKSKQKPAPTWFLLVLCSHLCSLATGRLWVEQCTFQERVQVFVLSCISWFPICFSELLN